MQLDVRPQWAIWQLRYDDTNLHIVRQSLFRCLLISCDLLVEEVQPLIDIAIQVEVQKTVELVYEMLFTDLVMLAAKFTPCQQALSVSAVR